MNTINKTKINSDKFTNKLERLFNPKKEEWHLQLKFNLDGEHDFYDNVSFWDMYIDRRWILMKKKRVWDSKDRIIEEWDIASIYLKEELVRAKKLLWNITRKIINETVQNKSVNNNKKSLVSIALEKKTEELTLWDLNIYTCKDGSKWEIKTKEFAKDLLWENLELYIVNKIDGSYREVDTKAEFNDIDFESEFYAEEPYTK